MCARRLTGVNQVVAISPALAKQLLDFEPGLNIEVIGESLRTDFFVPAETVDKADRTRKSFFVAARLAEQKGLEHLIKAVHLLVDKGLNSFEVVIGGDGPIARNSNNSCKRSMFLAIVASSGAEPRAS